MTRLIGNRFHLTFIPLLLTIVLVASSVSARSAPDSFADLAEKLLPAVVNISTTATTKQGAGKAPELPQFPPGSQFEEFFKDKTVEEFQKYKTQLLLIEKKMLMIPI